MPTRSLWTRSLLPLLLLLLCATSAQADERLAGIACRSVHLQYPGPESNAFYNEVTVRESAEGTFIMACGFRMGYFGMQQLREGRKVILFSVWEPGKQNNPSATPEDRRVKVLAQGEGVQVKRFGGEGTGGQSFYQYDWRPGQTCRFLVTAWPAGERTVFSGYFYVEEEKRWQPMATFSTLADKKLLRGYNSFVEDFRRNRVSATQAREAEFGNGWVRDASGAWHRLDQARFTADGNPATNIDAGKRGGAFYLATGGETKNDGTPLWQSMQLPASDATPPTDLPTLPKSTGVLRVLSYNIKHGLGNDGKIDLARAANLIVRLQPDLVALQEIDKGVERSGKIDQPAKLGELTGMHPAFGKFFDYQGGEYGMAVLSRWRFSEVANHPLPGETEPRTAQVVKVQPSAGGPELLLANVHFYATEAERLAQAKALLKVLDGSKLPAIVAGDFNSQPDSPVLELFAEEWVAADKGEDSFTFHAKEPNREIDYILFRRGDAFDAKQVDVLDEPVVSDHRPVLLDLKRLEEAGPQGRGG